MDILKEFFGELITVKGYGNPDAWIQHAWHFLWRDFSKELREPEQSKKHTSESVAGRMMDTRTFFHDILKGTDACIHIWHSMFCEHSVISVLSKVQNTVFLLSEILTSSLILELKYKEELGDDGHISWLNDCTWMIKSSLWIGTHGNPIMGERTL